eukprot:6471023-Amphidinium_carterae.1
MAHVGTKRLGIAALLPATSADLVEEVGNVRNYQGQPRKLHTPYSAQTCKRTCKRCLLLIS